MASPTTLSVFNGKVAPKSSIGGHSMGGGSSFLAAASNTSVTCIFNFASATTNPSSIASSSLISVPALIISGAIDCVADTTVQNSHYNALASSKKFHVILKQLTHCDFGNGSNFNCTFGQSSSGCSNVVANALALPRYMNYLQNFLDNQLKNDCAAGQRFMDSVNTSSSLRAGLKKTGSIACSITSLKQSNSNSELRVYPNPATSNIYIDLTMTDIKLKISDLYGKVLLDREYKEPKNSLEVSLSEFKSGIYILEVESATKKKQIKIVKD